jgi:hypothetical protein
MKSKIAALLFSTIFSLGTASAEDITFINLYGPGGGLDKSITALSDDILPTGKTVAKKYFKSCVDALEFMKNEPKNTFLLTMYGDVRYETSSTKSICPMIDTSVTNLRVYSSIVMAPAYLVTVPGFAATTLDKVKELSKTQKIKIGFVYDELFAVSIDKFAKKSLTNYVLLPFNSSSSIRAAIAAKDIDLVYTTSTRKEIVDKGGVDIAVSSKKFVTADRPYMGDPEFVTGFYMSAIAGATTPDIAPVIKHALGSASVDTLATAVSGQKHSIATNVSAEETDSTIKSLLRELK